MRLQQARAARWLSGSAASTGAGRALAEVRADRPVDRLEDPNRWALR